MGGYEELNWSLRWVRKWWRLLIRWVGQKRSKSLSCNFIKWDCVKCFFHILRSLCLSPCYLSICECFWWPFNILWRDSHYYGQKRWLMSKQMRCSTSDAGTGGQGGHWLPQYLPDPLTLFQPREGRLSPLLVFSPPNFFTFRHHWVRIRRQKNDVAIFSLSLLLQCTVSPFYFLRRFELTKITVFFNFCLRMNIFIFQRKL